MAIFHLSTKPISRADGRSAVAAAAYRSASELADERTGQVFDYTRKGGVLSSEIVTPEGVPVPERETLWNAAEAAERRKDSRVAREWRGALPAELNEEQQRTIAHRWAKEYADRYGVAVDVAIHAPDKDGDDRNFHVHMLATTRKIDANGELGEKAAIELGNKDRGKAGIPGTTQDEIVEFRARWAEITNEEMERQGLSERIDHRSYADRGIDLVPTTHIGVQAVGMDRRGSEAERIELHDEVRRENARKIEENPSLIIEKITSTQAVFDRRDMARELHRHIDDPAQFQNILARLEQDKQLVQLAPERTEGSRTIPAKYSTREMIDTERRMMDTAESMAGASTHGVDARHVQAAIERRGTLSDEQRQAVEHVTGDGRLAVIIGDAGTGKSFAMATAREAWEAQGYRVRGAALAGKAADELQAGSGIDSRTLASLEYGWKEGRDPLTSRDVLVIDEAGMVGSRQLGRVLDQADKAGAKVVLLGDDKQLAAIEAGAGFRAITERTGAAEITEIRRQREAWAREASSEFARGDVRTALDAYNERGGVRLVESREDAKAAIAADYLADRQLGGSAIILAHSNKDVAGLNEAIRTARAEAGELGPSAEIQTSRGKREFAQGDRLLFMKNDRDLDVKNGTLGTVQKAEDGRLSVMLDSGREVAFSAKAYEHIDHGYAVTVHKAQGVTVDRAYLLATPGMDRSLTYVGMTRHRDAATLYAGADDFTDRRAGRLVEHGAAPYENNPENSDSYYVSLETDKGQRRTIWGVDLERAITESGTKLGDRIGLEHVGSETVQLPDGQTAERNRWQVRDSAELAYEKLADRLAQQRPKESTLDFAQRHGVEVDEGAWSVTKLDQAEAKALAERIEQKPAAAVQGVAAKEADRTPRISFERLAGAEKMETAKPASPEKPTLADTLKTRNEAAMAKRGQEREQAQPSREASPAAPTEGKQPTLADTLKARNEAAMAKRAQEKGQAQPDHDRAREAAAFVRENLRQRFEKEGRPVDEKVLQQFEQAAMRRFEKNPHDIDQALKQQAAQRQQESATKATTQEHRPAQGEAQQQRPEPEAKQQEAQAKPPSLADTLKARNEAAMAKRAQEKGQDGPER